MTWVRCGEFGVPGVPVAKSVAGASVASDASGTILVHKSIETDAPGALCTSWATAASAASGAQLLEVLEVLEVHHLPQLRQMENILDISQSCHCRILCKENRKGKEAGSSAATQPVNRRLLLLLRTLQCTQFALCNTLHCIAALYSLQHSTLYNLHCTIYIVHSTLYTLHCTLFTVYTVCTLHFKAL